MLSNQRQRYESEPTSSTKCEARYYKGIRWKTRRTSTSGTDWYPINKSFDLFSCLFLVEAKAGSNSVPFGSVTVG
ncbi:hypothetical protein CEXT_3601 [Caerostris extrusa]|uniref:Uncharacterized protein n=1 Tax=Caerostris extrusa TaxID=172846 RepID=A0AAV4QSP8_CAEEX|nr:hypothetical protein CEXT_3601 [Caerostris extrusa]